MANDIAFEVLSIPPIGHLTEQKKDFSRLEAIIAPRITLDYSDAFGTKYENISASAFLKMSSHPKRLGGLVDCIHLIGSSKFKRTGPNSVTGYHQIRTEYKRWKTMDKKEVEATGQGLAMMLHFYEKIDGKWKLAGTKPTGRMSEFNFENIFKDSDVAKL
ncbi:NTF2-like protein [Rhizodiscina lignyota]|uniref:NTF2-like protein n=1 Tax=Rhizodiscina lignyota TaxID=1504668 RepID=A0A9P4M698_9PEZI|nr:NTF2-like protein [Rhizodiscina lignyota]